MTCFSFHVDIYLLSAVIETADELVLAYHAIFCIALGTASNPLLKDGRCWKDRFEDQCIGGTLTLEYAACLPILHPFLSYPVLNADDHIEPV